MDIQKYSKELLATGLTQSNLAALAGCSQSLIAAFVKGTRGKRPSFDVALNIKRLHSSRCRPELAEKEGA